MSLSYLLRQADMNQISRRNFLKAAAGATGSLLLPPAFPLRALGKTQTTLRIGYLPITDATPLLIAHAKGFFADEGLNAERPIRIRNWSTLAESFLAGKFDVTHMLLPIPIWIRYKNRAPVKVLAWDHTNGSAITVRGDSEINGFTDLGGKHLAIPYWYSMHNIILQMGLRKAGLTPVIQPQSRPLKADQVNLFVLSPPEMPAALAGKKIDGFVVAEPFNALAELKINAKIMRFTGDIWRNHPCCVVVMNELRINQDPVFTQKVMNAIVQAQLWTNKNPIEAAKILSKEGGNYLPVSEDALLRVFTHYDLNSYGAPHKPTAIQHPEWKSSRISFQPYPYPSATQFITEKMRSTVMEGDNTFLHALDPRFVTQDLVDDSFVKNAINMVGGANQFEQINLEHPWGREEIILL